VNPEPDPASQNEADPCGSATLILGRALIHNMLWEMNGRPVIVKDRTRSMFAMGTA
jgi:hypothetical protein